MNKFLPIFFILFFTQKIFPTELHDAVKNYDERKVESLVKSGSSVNAPDKDGNTPLHWAAIRNSIPIADFLMVYGAKIDVKNSSGYTPLDLAIGANSLDMIRFFAKFISKKQKKNKLFRSACKVAKRWGCQKILSLLPISK